MNKTIYRNIAQLLPILTLMWTSAQASSLSVPVTFPNGVPVSPSGANLNFSAVETSVNDNFVRINQLAAQLVTLQVQNAALQTYISQLQAVMQLQTDDQGHPAVVFSGVNVHINNGMGWTQGINGRGNLIIGYDEPTVSSIPFCSDGQFRNETSCINNGYSWLASQKTGSHNLIVGHGHNYSQFGGFVAGLYNTVNAPNASILGGDNNMASGTASTIAAGLSNKALGDVSSVSGGNHNTAFGIRSTVSGGAANIANGAASSVSGGTNNAANGVVSNVSGGYYNNALGEASNISGGYLNNTLGEGSNISGGYKNSTNGIFSSVGGGNRNSAAGSYSSVSGGYSRGAVGTFDWVAGGLAQDQ